MARPHIDSTASPPPSLKDASWLRRAETQAVFAALTADGHEARCVGGAVRNALIGKPVVDVDIATTALPEESIALGAKAGLNVLPTGLQHGTVTLVSGGIPHEVTTLRRDVETDGRRAKVGFTDDWTADASRRDFTINALYCDAGGTIFDPLGGHADLAARRVRFIGHAGDRINEDYLRILRFFRFNAEYGDGPVDPVGLSACIAARDGLSTLSAERVQAEMIKLLAAPRAVAICEVMQETGFLAALLGVAPRGTGLKRLAALEAALGRAADPLLRLAALSIAVDEDAPRLRDRLRLSKAQGEVLQLASAHEPMVLAGTDAAAAKRLLYRLGPPAYQRRLLIDWARAGTAIDDAGWLALYDLPNRWTAPRLPLTGTDVLALGLPPGPAIGGILRAFETWWIEHGFSGDEPANRAMLAELANDVRRNRFDRSD